MIIDCHQHPFWFRHNDADLVADMDEHGIDFAWVLTWEIPSDEPADWFAMNGVFDPALSSPDGATPGISLTSVLAARDHFPDRFVVGYCPNPRLDNAPALFEAAYHMHRARVCGEWKFRVPIDDPRCLELFRKAGELKCPVLLHLDVPYLADAEGGPPVYQRFWYGGTVENLRRALRACPETIFIGHGPGFWREISADAEASPKAYPEEPVAPGGRVQALLEEHANLYADLSAGSGRGALARDPDHAREFLHRFADRVMFGRDYHGKDLHEFLQSLDLPTDVSEKIYFRNAAGLVEPPAAGR